MGGARVIWRLAKLAAGRELKCRGPAMACVGLEVLGVVLAAAGPFVLKQLIDAFARPTSGTWDIPVLAVSFVLAWTGATLLTTFRSVYSSRINSRMATQLAAGAVAGFLSNGVWRQADSSKVQGLIERVPYDLALVVDGLIWRSAPLAIQLALSIGIMARVMSWSYAMAFTVLSAGFVIVSWVGLKKQAVAANGFNASVEGCGSLVGDILRNPRRIVSNGAIGLEVAAVGAAYEDRARADERTGWSLVRLSGAQWGVIAVSLVLILIMAGADVAHGRLSTGDFVLLQAYALRLVLPLSAVAFILSQAATALINLDEMLGLQHSSPQDTVQMTRPRQLRPANVEVFELTYAYPKGAGGVEDITVTFPASSFSVIVGRNGAGKSTLAQLLAGLLTPFAGRVEYDGLPIDGIEESLRYRHVLYVPQRVGLLNRTVRDNLRYPPGSSDEATAVHHLEAWQFYDTGQAVDLDFVVGEGGEALSGGQLQKLELARLMGMDVPCLILDESTSALDPASEARIVHDLRAKVGHKTTLIFVAHRVALAQVADQVLWMRQGRLAAVGGHEELAKEFTEYRELWSSITPP